jgi:hypothetical protein
MSKDDQPADLIGYEALQQTALRGVVRAALERAAEPRGLPGDHHFYISFRTDAADVSVPADLRARYPEEMTIVLQHQYWDLTPGETAFSVTLQFNSQPKSLSIPYVAVTRFYDPSIHYLLQFTPPPPGPPAEAKPEVRPSSSPDGEEAPKVVSLDQFRKK